MRVTRLISRIGLSALIIFLGVVAALLVGETRGLALADLPDTSVRALAITGPGRTMYASLTHDAWPAGLYRSDDSGQSWQAVAPELNIDISVLAVHPKNEAVLYAGAGGGSLFKTSSLWASQDGGRTWRRFVAPLPASPSGLLPAVTALVIDPAQPEILYAGTDGHGVYRYDTARNGYELLAGFTLRDAHVRDVAVDSGGRVYALTDTGLFVTEGDTWQRLEDLPASPLNLALASGASDLLYLGAADGLYRSDNGGRNWEEIGPELPQRSPGAASVTALAVDKAHPRTLAAAIADGPAGKDARGVYLSQDAGETWLKLSGPSITVTELTFSQGAAYAATAGGLVRYSQPAASTWFSSLAGRVQAPNGAQLLIIVLTVALAGLVLLHGEKWLSEQSGWFSW